MKIKKNIKLMLSTIRVNWIRFCPALKSAWASRFVQALISYAKSTSLFRRYIFLRFFPPISVFNIYISNCSLPIPYNTSSLVRWSVHEILSIIPNTLISKASNRFITLTFTVHNSTPNSSIA